MNENKMIDCILGLAGGFIAGWLAKALANVLGM